MSDLFHSSPVPLGVGSVIEPGNWGRIVRTYGPDAHGSIPINGLNEISLEFARLIYAPDKPSRLNCVFCIETLEGAISYRNMHHAVGIIYRVEPLDEHWTIAQGHIGDHSLPIASHGAGFVGAALQRFRDYWLSEHTENREVLLSCPVRILERLD